VLFAWVPVPDFHRRRLSVTHVPSYLSPSLHLPVFDYVCILAFCRSKVNVQFSPNFRLFPAAIAAICLPDVEKRDEMLYHISIMPPFFGDERN
jgi:hypothetical protein